MDDTTYFLELSALLAGLYDPFLDPSAEVDRWGRTHDAPNLWSVASSVFSTSATANPTLTIAALTLCADAAIHRQIQGGD